MRDLLATSVLAILSVACSGPMTGPPDGGGGGGSGGGSGGGAAGGSGGGSGGASGGVGSGSLTGSLAFEVRLAVTVAANALPDGGPDMRQIILFIADDRAIGDSLCRGQPYPGGRVHALEAQLSNMAGNYAGTYSSGQATILYRDFDGRPDGGATDHIRAIASSGMLSVASQVNGGLAGSVNLQFVLPDGGSAGLSGSYDAPFCGVLRR